MGSRELLIMKEQILVSACFQKFRIPNLSKNFCETTEGIYFQARRNLFLGGSEVHQWRACKGVAAWGFRVAPPPPTPEKFSKNL